MDDIGNIIYIIFTLVAIMLGMFGSKNKKKQPGQQQSKPGFMEELERALRGDQEPAGTPVDYSEEELEAMAYAEEGYRDEAVYEEEPETPEEPKPQETYTPNEEVLDQQVSILEAYDRIMRSNQAGEEEFLVHEGDSGLEGELKVINLEEEQHTDFSELLKDFDARKAIVYAEIINRKEF